MSKEYEYNSEDGKTWVKGRLLIVSKEDANEDEVEACISAICEHEYENIEHMHDAHIHIVDLHEGDDEREIMAKLSNNPLIEAVELDELVKCSDTTPTDPNYSSSWHLPKINAPVAWDYAKGEDIIIAILDTGIDVNHPDLAGNLVPGRNVKDGNDDITDEYGHGTKVAGVAAAIMNNGKGSCGVAPSAKIMPIRIAGADGYALFSHMVAGFSWARNNGARVVSLSFANAAGNNAINMAAKHMRIYNEGVSVIAAGNTGGKLDYEVFPDFLAVSGIDSNDALASWSSYGAFVDLCAPGVSIYTTTKGGGYGTASGTSFSAPMVAGVVALIMSKNPSLTAAEVETILLNSCHPLGSGSEADLEKFGAGRVDAGAALLSMLDNVGFSINSCEVTGVSSYTFSPSKGTKNINGKSVSVVRDLVMQDYILEDSSGVATYDLRRCVGGYLYVDAYQADSTQGAANIYICTATETNGLIPPPTEPIINEGSLSNPGWVVLTTLTPSKFGTSRFLPYKIPQSAKYIQIYVKTADTPIQVSAFIDTWKLVA